MPFHSDAQRRFFHSPAARRAGISADTVHEFDRASKGMDLPEKVDHKAMGGVVRCPGCGMHHYADGGEVDSSGTSPEERHESERQERNQDYYENATASLRRDRPRVTTDDEDKQPRPPPPEQQASNYAYGGTVDDPPIPIRGERGYDDADDRPEFEEERRYANDGMRRTERMVHRGWQSEAPRGREVHPSTESDNYNYEEGVPEGSRFAEGGLADYLGRKRMMRKGAFGRRG